VPTVPTMSEQGVNGVDAYIWQGLYGPKGMPDAIRDRLNAAVAKIINEASFKERVAKAGYELISSSPEQLSREVVAEKGMWNRIITDKNIKAE
jgi:tripartite-type tricarboxylate transporter receptor subunit TctC